MTILFFIKRAIKSNFSHFQSNNFIFQNKTNQMKCFKFSNSSEKCTKWIYDKSQFESTIITEVSTLNQLQLVWLTYKPECRILPDLELTLYKDDHI